MKNEVDSSSTMSAGSFREQRLVIERKNQPRKRKTANDKILKTGAIWTFKLLPNKVLFTAKQLLSNTSSMTTS